MTFRYVWNPFLEDHLRAGWMLAGEGLIGNRGGQFSWLMCWPCQCRMPNLRAA